VCCVLSTRRLNVCICFDYDFIGVLFYSPPVLGGVLSVEGAMLIGRFLGCV
jgi:hypothetical protein